MSAPARNAPRDPDGSPPRRVILFDLDGTLIDSLELLIVSMQHAFASRVGPRPSVEEWVSTIGRPLRWQFSQYAVDAEDLESLIVNYRAYQSEHHDRLTRAYHGIPELLAELRAKEHALGVVTSKMDPVASRSLEHVGIAQYFDVVVGADKTTRHKPEPEPILYALEQLSARPGQAVYVGDSQFDVLSANAAGVTSIAVTWGASDHAQLAAANPTHVVGTPEALKHLLAELPPLPTP